MPSHSMDHPSNEIPAQLRVGVVGVTGYSGLELARLLLRHPLVDFRACFATQKVGLEYLLPEAARDRVKGYASDQLMTVAKAESLELIFLATPPEVSLVVAPALLQAGIHVIDLSAAYRFSHPPELPRPQYGLIPWADLNPVSELKRSKAMLIANPGCFATAALMALIPLLRNQLIDSKTIVIDAKSGTTGAGRKPQERLLHAEVEGLCLPYRVGHHQHLAEIQKYAAYFSDKVLTTDQQKAGENSGDEPIPQKNFHGVSANESRNQPLDLHFTTHLLSVRRGIIAGLYLNADSSAGEGSDFVNKVMGAYVEAYAGNPLVEVAHLDAPAAERLLNLRRVVGSARTQIAFQVVGRKLYVFSLIDNLLKGAASQAVENMNRILAAPAWLGLKDLEGVL